MVVSRSDSRWETVKGENLVETTEMILTNVVAFTWGSINEKGLMDVCCSCLSNPHFLFWKERPSLLWRPKEYKSTLSPGLSEWTHHLDPMNMRIWSLWPQLLTRSWTIGPKDPIRISEKIEITYSKVKFLILARFEWTLMYFYLSSTQHTYCCSPKDLLVTCNKNKNPMPTRLRA